MVGAVVCVYFAASMLDPNREERKRKEKYAEALKKRLGRKLNLNPMEMMLTDLVLNPREIDVTENDIMGQENLLEDLHLKVVCPLLLTDVYKTALLRQAKGLLLYGPPGTGKTMIAKALAQSSGCFFINVTASSILSKWYGDAQKYVRATWSLAEKLQPCIIFIDEVDSFLGKRGSQTEHEATLSVKTEFMQCWEGMETQKGMRVLVMGATNRPESLDPAVLRRFSLKYRIGLPDQSQRKAIVRGYIEKHMQEAAGLVGSVCSTLLDDRPVRDGLSALGWIAKKTETFSGSDLHELCAQAAQRPVQDAIKKHCAKGGNLQTDAVEDVRSLELKDFEESLKCVQPGVDEGRAAVGDSSFVPEGTEQLQAVFKIVGALMEVQRQTEERKKRENGAKNAANGVTPTASAAVTGQEDDSEYESP
ncbi:unnamed protein product [Ostreobium quekettii]|uniref:AAA+ ATPase domain-containing protein n=1 Tax=Ostreobium quekettii TaxID=121088 RepID=A0A8S1JBQ6_9CHLO|nr:unnamed protein product [Ostreobium quekettii]